MQYPPIFYMHLLPKAEQIPVWHIEGLLIHLSGYVDRFESAVLLSEFQTAQESARQAAIHNEPDDVTRRALIRDFMSDKTMEWINIAHRDSIMTVYHFAETFKHLKRTSLKNCPKFRSLVDTNKLDLAWSLFNNNRFPDWKEARHTIGHSAELALTREKAASNSLSAPYESEGIKSTGKGLLLVGVREGDKMTTTRADEHTKIAKPLTTSCSRDAFAKLARTRDEVFTVFEEAARKLSQATSEL